MSCGSLPLKSPDGTMQTNVLYYGDNLDILRRYLLQTDEGHASNV